MTRAVEQIKGMLSIVDFLESYIKLEKSGSNYKARCPFHNEKTPSFYVSPDRNSYYCFGCGEKGDIFSFVQKFEGVDFKGALKILADRTGITLDEFKNDSKDEKSRLYEALEKACIFFEENYLKNSQARAYLFGRGLSDETIKNFRIGFAPDNWHSVSKYLSDLGFTQKEILDAGLTKQGEKGVYDRFRSRIMFPISDSSGRVIAFSGRIFGKEDDKEAKYLNSPDTILFNKSNVLFGIDKAKSEIRKRGYTVIVEGQMDLILSHQIGIINTVAVSGTALASTTNDAENTINNLGLIKRLSSNVILAFDGDSAGVRAAGRSALIALSLDMQVKIAQLPLGLDPADIIRNNPEDWKDILKNAKHVVRFFTEKICFDTKDERARGRQIREIVFPYLHAQASAIEQSVLIKEIHDITSIPMNAIQADFELYKKSHLEQPKALSVLPSKEKNINRKEDIEKKILGMLIVLKNKNIEIPDNLNKNDQLDYLFSKYNDVHDTLAFEAEMWYGDDTEVIRRNLRELIMNLEEEVFKERIAVINESFGKTGNDNELLKELQDLRNKIEHINKRRSQ